MRPTPDPSPLALPVDTRPVIVHADCREGMRSLADGSVHCCITSPPYFLLRDYGLGTDQLGMEPTPDCGLRGKVRLRRDLTEDQKARVVRWLLGEVGSCDV